LTPTGVEGQTLRARITFLGTGTSSGVPMIGCTCAVCQSTDPRDQRLRPSIYVDVPGRAGILVDTGTDLRQQALTHKIARVDAILYTHAHADHVMGLDDVRRFNFMQGGAIPCYANETTWESLRSTFAYVFDPKPRKEGGGVPKLLANTVDGPFEVAGLRIVPVPLWHGSLPILGYRFGSFAYLTDCNRLGDEAWGLVEGVETLVIDALRTRPHSTHFTIDEAIAAAAKIGARRTYFTHMCHDVSYAETSARLPAGVELAYDGLVLDADVDAS
jgi:phosphoribosyl 1,2-cyclic phosphate phosphodiesterase